MCTRSSPTQSEDGEPTVNQAISALASVSTRCHWSKDDDINLITFLIRCKTEAGDLVTFKSTTWTAASQCLEKTHIKGGPKHPKACSDKWARFKELYYIVKTIKNLSDLFWSNSTGLDINPDTEDVFNTYIKTNPKAAQFKTTGFPYFELMEEVMPKVVKGVHAFRPSQQSHGAASDMPAPSSKGKGKWKPNEQEQGVETDDDGKNNSDHNNPAIVLPPSPVPTSTIHSSTSASLSAASGSGSKRKHSALDDDNSTVSARSNSHKSSGSKSLGTNGLEGINVGLMNVGSSIQDLATERKAHRIQQEAHIVAQATRSAVEAWELSPKRRQNAVERLQEAEGHLKPRAMICLIDYIVNNTTAADIYMTLKREDYCRAWVLEWLKECGYVNEVEVEEVE